MSTDNARFTGGLNSLQVYRGLERSNDATESPHLCPALKCHEYMTRTAEGKKLKTRKLMFSTPNLSYIGIHCLETCPCRQKTDFSVDFSHGVVFGKASMDPRRPWLPTENTKSRLMDFIRGSSMPVETVIYHYNSFIFLFSRPLS